MALHAAAEAGIKTDEDKKLWKDIREMMVTGQHGDGGWGYIQGSPVPTTHTMTLAGLCDLLCCDSVDPPTPASKKAVDNGFDWVGKNLQFDLPGHTYYNLLDIARLGKLSGKDTFDAPGQKRDWYREGAAWLLKHQLQDGSFKGANGPDAMPVISTSFALLFLAARD
jgi:hypothetical protein